MPYKEKEIVQKYFSITKACEIINEHIDTTNPNNIVVPSTLRYWESRSPLLMSSRKNAKGSRKYTIKRIQEIILFANILHTGWYTVEGAIRELQKAKKYVKFGETLNLQHLSSYPS